MIWEVDEDLDQRIDFYEFELMYKRNRFDDSGLEPKNLYNLVQFLMFLKSDTYLKSDSNKEQQVIKKKITVEDTLELLYVRYGRDMLDKEIEIIFGKEEKTADG